MKVHLFICLFFILPIMANAGDKQVQERHHEDPTKVVTKLGIGYSDNLTFSGSLSVDHDKKINIRFNEDNSQWQIGGSWLFDVGIVNVAFRHSEYDHGAEKDSYSIGSFIPLSRFNISPFDTQIFISFGVNKNEGEIAVAKAVTDFNSATDYLLKPSSSQGGYLGYFALKSLNQHWSALSFGGVSKGSDNFSASWIGGGLSYKFNAQQSINGYAMVYDNDFDSGSNIGFSYTYEFDDFYLD